MSVQDKILDAIELLAENSVKKAGYDKTIQAQILSCEDATIGKYRCRYQDATIYAYTSNSDVTFNKGSYVYILVPGGNMGKEKTILGTTKKLGINYISQAQGDQAYNIIGNNCIISNNIFYLDTKNKNYKYTIYKYNGGNNNKISFDEEALKEYLQQSSSLIVGGMFKTDIDPQRQYKGHYGITFNLRFKDNATSNQIIRSYTLNEDNMIDNPYRLLYETRQYEIFNIDGSSFIRIESIEIFNQNFPGADGTTTTGLLSKGDIIISSLELSGATRMTEEEINGVAISFYTPQGTVFTGAEGESNFKTITAQVRIKGKLASSAQDISFYWGNENVRVTPTNAFYNKHLGRGWACLNKRETAVNGNTEQGINPVYVWIPGSDTYTVTKSAATAAQNRFKVAVVYNGTVITKIITIKNLTNQVPKITIQSDEGTKFYYDIGHPILTCKINGNENKNYNYYWGIQSDAGVFTLLYETTTNNTNYHNAVEKLEQLQNQIAIGERFANAEAEELNKRKKAVKAFDSIQRVEKNQIHKVQINTITNLAIFKCSVYDGSKYLGTASITLTNSLKGEDLYSLVINNSSVVFQYNEYGVAPNNKSLEQQQNIQALSFTIYDNLGNPVDNDVLLKSKNCSIRWEFPIKDTLLVNTNSQEDSGTDSTQTYRYYDNVTNLTYDIAQRYDIKKQNNQIKLTVDYKGMNLTTKTDFTFTKQGEPGTNGTEYIVKVVPNTRLSSPPVFPIVTYSGQDKEYILNYGLGSINSQHILNSNDFVKGDGNRLLKVQLWHSGEMIWEGFTTFKNQLNGLTEVKWENLINKYSRNYTDDSAFIVSSDGYIKVKNQNYFYGPGVDGKNDWLTREPLANIIKCSITYEGKTYYGTCPIVMAWVNSNKYRVSLADHTGFKYVLYTSDGTSPQYDNSHPFEFKCKENINNVWEDVSLIEGDHSITYDFAVNGNIKKGADGTLIKSNLLTIIKDNTLEKNQCKCYPNSKYDGECVNNAIICAYKNKNNKVMAYIQVPIHFLLNRYGLANLNAWDGNNVQINEQGGYILAPQMGAGEKDKNNNFTGVVMGVVKQSDSSSKNGLLGFSKGIMSIYLDANTGNATFGRPGEGQIKLVPEGTSTIAEWRINSDCLMSKDEKTILYANENHLSEGRSLRFNINDLFKVYSDGYIKSTAGTIGGWTIEEDSLHTNQKIKYGQGSGAFLGADGILDFTSSSGRYLRYDGANFLLNGGTITGGSINIDNKLLYARKGIINLGSFVVGDEYGRNLFCNENKTMAISANLNNSTEWWMWFGESSSSLNPEDYDFVLNGSGQVYAKDFITPNGSISNIYTKLSELQERIQNLDDGGEE